jgi:Predicted membrane protein (DUF2207) C-terminal domain/Predicted membrane protein (DUF2207) N-terminal domain
MPLKRRALPVALIVASVTLLAGFGASAYAARPAEDRVSSYAAELNLGGDGVLHVQETVALASDGDTVSRVLRTRLRSDADRDRVWELRNISATVGGKSAEVKTEDVDDGTKVDVRTGSGDATVVYTYDVDGGVADSIEGRQVSWPIVQGFDSMIPKATISASIPFASWVSCFAGRDGSSVPCTSSQLGESAAIEIEQAALPPGGRVTLIAGLSGDATVSPNAEFAERWSLGRAFSADGTTLGLSALLLGLGVLGAAALWLLRGRDAAKVADGASGPARPVLEGADGPQFAAPDGIRPGQVGTVVDESADLVDITATLLDLAVRNYLSITELPRENEFGRMDWTLARRHEGGPELLPYEKALLDAIFADGNEVTVSSLGSALRPRLTAVRENLYADVVTQGWFTQRPDAVRNRWTTAGLVLILAGAVLTVVLAAVSKFGLVGLAVMLAGVALALAGQEAPARTARGAAVLGRISGLRAYLAGESAADLPEQHRLEFASRCLPYATVLGLTEKWALEIAATDEDETPDEGIGWYNGPENWHLSNIGESLSNFVTAVNGSLSTGRRLFAD